jgi:hypothetical protein
MAHAQKPDLVFPRKGRVHLNRRGGGQFSRLLAAEMCASAVVTVVMLGTPCSEVACKTTGYPLHSHVSPSLPLLCVTLCHQVSTELYLLEPSNTRNVLNPLTHLAQRWWPDFVVDNSQGWGLTWVNPEPALGFTAAHLSPRYSRQQHDSFSHWLLYFTQRFRAFTDAPVKLNSRLQNSTARTRMCMQIPMSGAQYIEVLK